MSATTSSRCSPGPARACSASPTSSRTSAGLARTAPPKMEPALDRRPGRIGAWRWSGAGSGGSNIEIEVEHGDAARGRLRPVADQPGDPEPPDQRHPGDRGDGPHGGRPDPRLAPRRRATRCSSTIADNGCGIDPERSAPALRPVLHDQARGRGDRPGPVDLPRDHHRPRRPDRGREPPGEGTCFRIFLPLKSAVMTRPELADARRRSSAWSRPRP